MLSVSVPTLILTFLISMYHNLAQDEEDFLLVEVEEGAGAATSRITIH